MISHQVPIYFLVVPITPPSGNVLVAYYPSFLAAG
jgi:hypothetical protein